MSRKLKKKNMDICTYTVHICVTEHHIGRYTYVSAGIEKEFICMYVCMVIASSFYLLICSIYRK